MIFLKCYYTVLNLSKLKFNATEPQPQRTVSKRFAIFKNDEHSLASHQAPNYVQRSLIAQNVMKQRQHFNLPEPN